MSASARRKIVDMHTRIEALEMQNAELMAALKEANTREANDYNELLDEFNKVKVQNVQLLSRLAELTNQEVSK